MNINNAIKTIGIKDNKNFIIFGNKDSVEEFIKKTKLGEENTINKVRGRGGIVKNKFDIKNSLSVVGTSLF